jgi:hypothetical protein
MKGIAQLYAQYINKSYQRSGYLWESRFKSCLVQSENYVLTCYRYIELNPYGLVSRHAPTSTHGRATHRTQKEKPRPFVLGSPGFKVAVSRAVDRRVEKGSAGRPAREGATKDQLDLL